jgi:hypothetical protein
MRIKGLVFDIILRRHRDKMAYRSRTTILSWLSCAGTPSPIVRQGRAGSPREARKCGSAEKCGFYRRKADLDPSRCRAAGAYYSIISRHRIFNAHPQDCGFVRCFCAAFLPGLRRCLHPRPRPPIPRSLCLTLADSTWLRGECDLSNLSSGGSCSNNLSGYGGTAWQLY